MKAATVEQLRAVRDHIDLHGPEHFGLETFMTVNGDLSPDFARVKYAIRADRPWSACAMGHVVLADPKLSGRSIFLQLDKDYSGPHPVIDVSEWHRMIIEDWSMADGYKERLADGMGHHNAIHGTVVEYLDRRIKQLEA